eukprot:scaffold248_cov148-Ochromonas_danica.AAC.2
MRDMVSKIVHQCSAITWNVTWHHRPPCALFATVLQVSNLKAIFGSLKPSFGIAKRINTITPISNNRNLLLLMEQTMELLKGQLIIILLHLNVIPLP